MKPNFLSLIFLLSTSFSGLAQTGAAEAFFEKALSFCSPYQPDSVGHYLALCADAHCQQDSLEGWINAHKLVGRAVLTQAGNPSDAIALLLRSVSDEAWRTPSQGSEWNAMGWSYVLMGFIYNHYLRDFEQARVNYEKAAAIFREKEVGDQTDIANHVFLPLGNLNTRLGDYDAAIVFLQQALEAFPFSPGNNSRAALLSDLSLAYMSAGQRGNTIEVCREGLSIPGISFFNRGLLLSSLAKAYLEDKRYREALVEAKAARDAMENAITIDGFGRAALKIPIIDMYLGGIYGELQQPEDAIAHFRLAEQGYLDGGNANLYSRELGKIYCAWGELLSEQGRYPAALERYQKALAIVVGEYKGDDWSQNPEKKWLRAENTIVEALNGKAHALRQWYDAEGGPEKLETGLECYGLILEVERQLRNTYRYESSKLFNVEEARERSAKAIGQALELFRISGEPRYKEEALSFAERTKSILLLEAFYKSRAESLAGIPDSALGQEKQIQEELAELEEELFQARGQEKADSVIRTLESRLLEARQRYDGWVEGAERSYPDYYRLKYDVRTLSSTDIQQRLLSNGEAFIEYFVGSEQAYVFVITPNRFEALTLDRDFPLEEWVVGLHHDIAHFQFPDYDKGRLCASYSDYGYKLYDKLVRPLESLGLPERLTIIPSGILALLPFDALLTEPAEGCNFKQYPYLIRRHDISYGYSATLQAALRERPGGNHHFVGFAPAFDGSGGHGRLEHNISLLEAIHHQIGGELFTHNEATVAHLQEAANRSGILHFSSHAQANTEAGDFSFIVFSNGDGGYDSLFVKDVYLLPLQAEMVVLSACETSVGALYNGEGIISLARGFLYAGANSVATTLWSVNDQANSQLMEAYYRFLKQGYDKSQALRQAKLEQIEEHDRFHAHPAYWAAVTPIGNMRPVYQPLWVKLGWGGAGIFLLAGLLFLWLRRRRSGNEQQKRRKPEAAPEKLVAG
ncbi:MAG: CHAT domain-containing protein [Phaeodactylibacter sp.]|nr:CHAT domain-containing protein [Phaeodactylibacter sp.]MCB9054072.1 CHAT domain-containing protein [Lewinellaceae bacterium]